VIIASRKAQKPENKTNKQTKRNKHRGIKIKLKVQFAE
jgi:hypothetical protein